MEPILSLFRRHELFWQFLSRNVKARHRGSVLGAIWLVANPLLMLSLYVFAFGVVFGGRFTDSPDESTLDYALGVFLAKFRQLVAVEKTLFQKDFTGIHGNSFSSK